MRYAITTPELVDDLSERDDADAALAADLVLDADGLILRGSTRARRSLGERLPLDSAAVRHALRRRSGAFRVAGVRELIVVLRPLSCRAWPRAVARGYVSDPNGRAPGLRVALRSLWGLTIVESRVAELAMEGMGTDELASALGMARGTAQVHLRNIFRKVGVHRQAELVAMLWRTLPRWD